MVGLAVTRTAIPGRVWVWPGNIADGSVIEEVKSDLAGWKLGRAIWVVDRGIASEENLRPPARGGGHWIAGMRMRAGEKVCVAALARPGRYRQVRDNLRVKESLASKRSAQHLLHPLSRSSPAQGLAGTTVELGGDRVELELAVGGEV